MKANLHFGMIAAILIAINSYGYGPEGHKMIGSIADKLLEGKPASNIERNMKTNKTIAALTISALALSMIKVPANYSAPANGLIGYWPGNDSAVDASPEGNSGSFGGAPLGGKFLVDGHNDLSFCEHRWKNHADIWGLT